MQKATTINKSNNKKQQHQTAILNNNIVNINSQQTNHEHGTNMQKMQTRYSSKEMFTRAANQQVDTQRVTTTKFGKHVVTMSNVNMW